jgi:hypothetical protein
MNFSKFGSISLGSQFTVNFVLQSRVKTACVSLLLVFILITVPPLEPVLQSRVKTACVSLLLVLILIIVFTLIIVPPPELLHDHSRLKIL